MTEQTATSTRFRPPTFSSLISQSSTQPLSTPFRGSATNVMAQNTSATITPLSPKPPLAPKPGRDLFDAEKVFNFAAMKTHSSGKASGNVSTTSNNYVGFANFPNQVFRRAIRNGFEFTLMVVGRSGLGKSTFINTLFLAEINDPKAAPPINIGSTVRIEQKTVRLVENGVVLNLSLVDTPGFGGAIDNNKCWEPIQQYVDARYMEYLSEETKLERASRLPDKRVHLCFYFITPSGHGLDALDIEFMKRLHDRVNIVPVIAKADTMTREEIKRFKQQILRDLDTYSIKVYKFPEPEDPEDKRLMESMKARVPFAVIGSNQLKEEHGKKTRVREYPWGLVEVENNEHNDFLALRDMIIRTNLIDLIDVTQDVHYENFRVRQMGSLPKSQLDKDPFTAMEEERKQKERELSEKKKNFEKVFDDKVRDRESKIKERKHKHASREKEIAKTLEERRMILEQMRTMVSELRRGNLHDSKTSVFTGVNENSSSAPRNESPGNEKPKKKAGTLGIFNRNN